MLSVSVFGLRICDGIRNMNKGCALNWVQRPPVCVQSLLKSVAIFYTHVSFSCLGYWAN